MNKTKIEWCDSTWNPVTGCLHGCEYCYARRIAVRFGGASETHCNDTVGVECQWCTEADGKIHVLNNRIYDVDRCQNAPYPFEFDPTFHRYRLDEPQRKTKSQTIFVCSMADLFGEWVPDEWIEEVFEACEKAPQHRYLFLTKNPQRYIELSEAGKLPEKGNMWYGATATNNGQFSSAIISFGELWVKTKTFLSIEPILENININNVKISSVYFPIHADWVIIGAESGNRKNMVIPNKSWIDRICDVADESDVPVFMKDSLIPIVGEENMRREFPWDKK